MKKYNVEGDIDFFAELYKSLDDEENKNKTEDDDKICLITKKPLTDKFVEMSCGHKFNYIPLYYDILNHKKKFNNMEGSTTRLKQNEMRCPYCRKRSVGLLPHYEELNLPKVSGVNYLDTNYNVETDSTPVSSYYKKCEFLTPNIYFNFNSTNVVEIYTSDLNLEDCKYIKCTHMGTQIHYDQLNDNYGDDKHYCWNHKKIVIKNKKKQIADKVKEDKLKLKKEEKLKLNEEKLKLKQKENEEKLKLKEELKKSVQMAKMNKKTKPSVNNNLENENFVIGLSEAKNTVESEVETNTILLCQEILKSGKNKGSQCGDKIFENNLCKRHNKKNCA
jgi:hypothetical protein